MLDGDLFVTKWFFNIGAGSNVVSDADNEKYLQAELIQLRQGRWFLSRFCDFARQHNVGIFSGAQTYILLHYYFKLTHL